MKFLASLILATVLVAYLYIVFIIANIVPWWLTPVVIILALTFFIHITTEIGHKR